MKLPKSELDDAFRSAMRRLAATVSVITVWDGNTAFGMTATAVTSLAADPPSLLICINQSASMHPSLISSTQFCVNLLHRDQEKVGTTFADSAMRDVRFATGGWLQVADAPPYLPDAQASFLCERTELISFATHSICIGTILDIRTREDVDPLLYVDGNFTSPIKYSMGSDPTPPAA